MCLLSGHCAASPSPEAYLTALGHGPAGCCGFTGNLSCEIKSGYHTFLVRERGAGREVRSMLFVGAFGSVQRLRRPLYSGRRNSGRSETLFSRTRRSTDFSGAQRARPNIHIGARGPAAQEGFEPHASGSLRAGASHGATLKPRRQVYLFAAEQCT